MVLVRLFTPCISGKCVYNEHMKILVCDADQAVREVFDEALPGATIVYESGQVTDQILRAHPDVQIISLFVCSSLPKERIDMLPQLSCIVARSTGLDHIAVDYAKEKGIEVCNVAKYGAHTVAEFTFALLLTLSRRVYDAVDQVREEGSFDTSSFEGFDLFGKTIGVIGTGAIGRNVVGIARGFGMNVLMFDLYPDKQLEGEYARYASLDELLAEADVITLHVPYMKENHHLLNKDAFGKMKKGVYLINTARGELVETEALLDALQNGTILGAGLDVLEEERELKSKFSHVKDIDSMDALKTLIRDHALVDMPRVIITPHIAFFSKEAYREILTTSAQHAAKHMKEKAV